MSSSYKKSRQCDYSLSGFCNTIFSTFAKRDNLTLIFLPLENLHYTHGFCYSNKKYLLLTATKKCFTLKIVPKKYEPLCTQKSVFVYNLVSYTLMQSL